MKIIIHDLCPKEFATLSMSSEEDTIAISDNGTIRNCIGCFGCWIKTPGVCVIKDGYDKMGELLSKCSEVIIISKCMYGSYSPFVRNIWDRSISYLLPYFVTIKNETHHKKRYNNTFTLSVHFYGQDISPKEKETAKKLVVANATNFYASAFKTHFYNNIQDICEVTS